MILMFIRLCLYEVLIVFNVLLQFGVVSRLVASCGQPRLHQLRLLLRVPCSASDVLSQALPTLVPLRLHVRDRGWLCVGAALKSVLGPVDSPQNAECNDGMNNPIFLQFGNQFRFTLIRNNLVIEFS